MVLTAIVNLVLSVLLAKKIGIAGVLFSSAIARLVTYFWYEPVLLFKKYFSESSIVYFVLILKNLIITLLILGVNYAIFSHFIVNSWITLVIKAICVGFVSLILAVILYWRTSGMKLVINKIKDKL